MAELELVDFAKSLLHRCETDFLALEDTLSLLKEIERMGGTYVDKSKSERACVTSEYFQVAHELSNKLLQCAAYAIVHGGGSTALDVYNKTLLFDAPYSFDKYMLYVEHKRPQKEQYWLPRRKQLIGVANNLQDMEDGKLDELFLSLPPRSGKSLINETPVLTRSGWKNHGDLVVGDEVIGMHGQFKKVVAVHPKCMMDVLVTFSNGEKIQCHENHEWMFYDRSQGRVRTEETKYWLTRQLEEGVPGHRGHRYNLQLLKRSVVWGEEKKLPVDPYVLGVWLGDGSNQHPRICSPKGDFAIMNKFAQHGYEIRNMMEHKQYHTMYYDIEGLREQLQTFGMCQSKHRVEKFIPEEYLTADVNQRLELLAGLLDSDGTLTRKEHRYHFTTNSETMRDNFIALVSTFGWRCGVMLTTKAGEVSSSGIKCNHDCYSISFNPDMCIPCALARKQLKSFSKQRRISVVSMERVEPKEGNCITVEGDGMYLVGNTLIPTHNTTLMVFFMSWVMLRDSERSNLYCSFTDSVVGTFYNGLMEIFADNHTYDWQTVFPNQSIVSTNAKDFLINVDRKKRYASFTGRSLYGTLNGAVDCNGYEIADDLISGIEEAMNPDRLRNAWLKVDNNYLPRGKEGSKRLWIGTRWATQDIQGVRQTMLENDDNFKHLKWKAINVPALNDDDESNFDYDFGVGFSTEKYKERRASFEWNNDMASWLAQYQGVPVDRSGAVFDPSNMRFYNGQLPEGEPDRIFMAVDPAWGGGDYVAAPIVYQYAQDLYVVDVVFDNRDKAYTQPLIARKAMQHGVNAIRIESTKMTMEYADGVEAILSKNDKRINMEKNHKNWTGTGKEQRIFDKAPEIRERMIFLESGKRSKEYELFMGNVFSFVVEGKNKHDDAPDSLAMAIDMAFIEKKKSTIFKRPF